MGGYVLGTLE